jgi:hypothetical protein
MAIRRTATRSRARKTTTRARAGSKVPGISRIDQPSTRTFGWFCRFGYRPTPRGTRPRYTAFFGDASNGGKRKALTKAVAWLKHLQRFGRPPKR